MFLKVDMGQEGQAVERLANDLMGNSMFMALGWPFATAMFAFLVFFITELIQYYKKRTGKESLFAQIMAAADGDFDGQACLSPAPGYGTFRPPPLLTVLCVMACGPLPGPTLLFTQSHPQRCPTMP